MVEKQNDEARKAARRLDKDRKRVEMGSDYESSGGELEHDDEYDSEVPVIIDPHSFPRVKVTIKSIVWTRSY